MAARQFAFPADSRVILNPDSYLLPSPVVAETDLGILGSSAVAGFSYQANLRSNVRFGGQITGADITAINLIMQLILLDHSEKLMGMMFQEEDDIFEFFENYKLGHPIEETNPSMLKELLIRPTAPDKPHLYIPKALVFSFGPFVWDRRKMVYDSTMLSIAALWDADRGCAFRYGDPASFASITPPEPE